MKHNPISLIALVVLSTLAACTTTEQRDWNQIAITDLNAIHQHTLNSHPGYVDSENPQFAQIAQDAMHDALALSKQVEDGSGFAAMLRAYTAPFRDGHYVAFVMNDRVDYETGRYRWPGLFLAWRDNRVFVTHSSEDQSLVNATLLTCDGTPAKELILNNVFRFDTGKPTQPSYWARRTQRLFVDDGNPFVTLPKECVFKHAAQDGEKRVALSWRPLERETYQVMSRQSQFGGTPRPGVHEFGNDKYWINLPDFSPSGDTFAQMTQLIDRLADLRDELRSAEALVFDMRGNQGGNSAWGVRAIDAIWGKDYRLSRRHRDAVYVDWRVSDGNIEHAAHIVRILEDQKAEDMLAYFRPIANGLASVSKQQDYHRVVSNEPVDKVAVVDNPVGAQVLLLTHGVCASSCLDFVDEMMALENIIQIGYPTGSDTNYLELRQIDLPSGLARLALPVKVYRGRPRASEKYYSPTYRYDALDWSDEALESWVTKVVLPAMGEL